MNRKIFTIFVLLTLSLSITAVSALDFNDFMGSSNGEKVTINGIDFNIPAGYKEDVDEAMYGEVNETDGLKFFTWSKTYSIGEDNVISISVITYDGIKVNDSVAEFIGGDEKTINGVHGYDYTTSPLEGFTYVEDGKLVMIVTTEKDLLNQIVIN